jgi:hypothetical protein
MQKPKSINLEVFTWPRDSYGLFDYESSKVQRFQSILTSSSSFFRRENEVSEAQDQELTDGKMLLDIEKLENGHFVVHPFQQHGLKLDKQKFEKLWLAVRGFNDSPRAYRLCEGDVIRLGRMKFRVKEIQGSNSQRTDPNFRLADIVNLRINTDYSEEGGCTFKLPCRICLSEVYVAENPLISPCKCTGTMKYIHLSCLQMCLKSKINTRSSEFSLSFSWKTMSCDLCKKPYPHKFCISGNIVELIEIPKPPQNFIILESLCKDKNSNKGIHVLSFHSKKSIKLGRGHDCELRVSDISVSRIHAQITMEGEAFYLQDHNSKFGTLIQVKRPVALSQFDEYWFQSGRSLCKLKINRPWSVFCSCFNFTISPFESETSDFLPINTGITLSKHCGYYENCKTYKKNSNLLHEYNQLGFNSSYDEETSCFNLIEEVKIAEQSFNEEIMDISVEKSGNFINFM